MYGISVVNKNGVTVVMWLNLGHRRVFCDCSRITGNPTVIR
jgi:hypothetical protein